MKSIGKIGAQGDVAFIRVESLPEGLKNEASMIVAHSETGHHHRARVRSGFECERYTDPQNNLVSYLRIRAKGEEIKCAADKALADIDAVLIEHERSFDTHETIALQCEGDEAVYKVVRQRQLTPEGWTAVVD